MLLPTGIACAATAVLIGYVAGGTKTIRVGSGGVMRPNHSQLVIAEQFGTLASLYPNRIDLGLGRTPAPITSLRMCWNSNPIWNLSTLAKEYRPFRAWV